MSSSSTSPPSAIATTITTTTVPPSVQVPRRKIGSRACDACKIRKVRCSEVPPCTRCASIGIECTFNKRQATRGPRSLRAKTLAEIRSIQEQQQQQQQQRGQSSTTTGSFSVHAINNSPPPGDSARAGVGESDPPPASRGGGGTGEPTAAAAAPQQQDQRRTNNTTPVSSLIVRLCIFRLRLFPVWPILDAEAVIASLLRDPTDLETYALANAVCAAIIAQLKLPFEGRTDDNDPATAASMAAECQRAKAALLSQNDDESDHDVMKNLNMLRISFFQHIYHENMSPGGSKSLLFLREAITIAQIMGLHRKGAYHSLPLEESQMRRRIIWLLFVTERGVAMLHKLPTILVWQPNRFPPLDDTWINSSSSGGGGNNTNNNNGHRNSNNNNAEKQDDAHILPAFKKLVNLFWVFDQGGAFDIILNADDDADLDADSQRRNSRLEYLQRRLQEMSWAEERESNEVQQADILVTKSWMQAVLWRASTRRHHHQNEAATAQALFGVATASSHYQQTTIAAGPYRIVNDFLSHISHYSKTALEAHGPTIELKIYEIASALTDALASNLDLLRNVNSGSPNPSGPAGVEVNIRPVDMLVQLQRLLASSRGGNKPLLTLLCARIAEVENGNGGPSSPPDRVLGGVGTNVDGNEDDQEDADAIVFGMAATGYSNNNNNGERRLSNPSAASYLDIVRLDYPSQLPPIWPGGMRSDPSQNNNFNVDPGGNLGITFAQMTNESWNGWALDLSGMSQISML